MKIKIESLLKNYRIEIYRIGIIIFTIILTIIIPVASYLNFKSFVDSINCPSCPTNYNHINFGRLEVIYDSIIYFLIIIGIAVSISAYYIFQFPKNSIPRGILLLFISILYLISIILSSQLGILVVKVDKVQIITDFSGVYILLIIVMMLYIIKNFYDIIDFKLNQSYYTTISRQKRFKNKKFNQKLIKCPNCAYICRTGWKKCPICNTKI